MRNRARGGSSFCGSSFWTVIKTASQQTDVHKLGQVTYKPRQVVKQTDETPLSDALNMAKPVLDPPPASRQTAERGRLSFYPSMKQTLPMSSRDSPMTIPWRWISSCPETSRGVSLI